MTSRIEARAQELVHSAIADGRISASRADFWKAQLSQNNATQRTLAEETLEGLAPGLAPGDPWVT